LVAMSKFDCHLIGEGFACCPLFAPQLLESQPRTRLGVLRGLPFFPFDLLHCLDHLSNQVPPSLHVLSYLVGPECPDDCFGVRLLCDVGNGGSDCGGIVLIIGYAVCTHCPARSVMSRSFM